MKKLAHQTEIHAALRRQIRHLEHCMTLVTKVDEEVYRLGRDVFRNDLGLSLWLSEPAFVLKGAVPLEKLRMAKGRKAVVVGLKQIAYGVLVRQGHRRHGIGTSLFFMGRSRGDTQLEEELM